ncbi:Response regulator receiver domain-containing protein [Fodinibius salinus]|uniref:Response regulator receiver domain-containing protein n=1 Tax=Fodinibius salinus TaxID=860790 RepID=A0A5D3YFF5_9BACT|nr:response regulator [Fodinibius salinus]TYP91945.1 Response regulator receiver domain-containing protein [Fodinibius salinus]
MSSSISEKKILVVEDDMIIALALAQSVKQLGHAVVDKVTSGEGAINAALEHKPDLILMDIKLEKSIDGITAIKEIRKEMEVDVIFITGNSDRHNLTRAEDTNFIDYLVKPVQKNHLRQSFLKAFSETD